MLEKNGLTKIDRYGFDLSPNINRFNFEKLKPHELQSIKDDNPNVSVAKAFALSAHQSLAKTLGNVANPCALHLNSVVLKFETEEFSKTAFVAIANIDSDNPIKTISTTFNSEYLITIPAIDAKRLLVDVIGLDERAYNKMLRDVATLQRASLNGNIDSIAVGKGSGKVSADTKSWVENNGCCAIDFGDAIPFDILLNTLNKHFNRKNKLSDYKCFGKWTDAELNEDLAFKNKFNKGSYTPLKEGCLTTNQAAILLDEEVDDIKTTNKLLKQAKIELLEKIIFSKPSTKLSARIVNLVKYIDELPSIDNTSIISRETIDKAAKLLDKETAQNLKLFLQTSDNSPKKTESQNLLYSYQLLTNDKDIPDESPRKSADNIIGKWTPKEEKKPAVSSSGNTEKSKQNVIGAWSSKAVSSSSGKFKD
ncbi:MAG: hypothetical protein K0R98_1370 [Rickettsiaceae bacterium]|jgi:hypothetical protein|nr:hypothetical protein [Rickettsiaceae bacterium]